MAKRFGKVRTKLGEPVDLNGLIRVTPRLVKGKGRDAIELDFELLPFSVRRERKVSSESMGDTLDLDRVPSPRQNAGDNQPA